MYVYIYKHICSLNGLIFAQIKIGPPDFSILAIKVNLASAWSYLLLKSKAYGVVGGGRLLWLYIGKC